MEKLRKDTHTKIVKWFLWWVSGREWKVGRKVVGKTLFIEMFNFFFFF